MFYLIKIITSKKWIYQVGSNDKVHSLLYDTLTCAINTTDVFTEIEE